MADSFVIGETDFQVDPSSVRVDFPIRPDGLADVHIEVGGDQATFERVAASDEWSWALYAAFFFVRRYPVSAGYFELSKPIEIPHRDEAFEMNLYMMEYCEVRSVVVRREADAISVDGRVDLWGRDLPFRIHLERCL